MFSVKKVVPFLCFLVLFPAAFVQETVAGEANSLYNDGTFTQEILMEDEFTNRNEDLSNQRESDYAAFEKDVPEEPNFDFDQLTTEFEAKTDSVNSDYENLDDLFDTAEDDVIIEDTNIDHMQQFNEHESVVIKGNFTATGGMAGGWKNYDFKNPKATVAANIDADISFDLRPDRNFRLFCRFDTEVDPQKFDEGWSGLQIDRLYVDYIILPWISVSVGQFPLQWGEGKLFNPANLVTGIDSSVNLKFSFPLALNGINLVAYGRIRNRESLYSLENFNFAANLDKVFGKVKFSLGAKYNSKSGINTYFSTKAVFSNFEPYVDFCYDFFYVGTDDFYSSFKIVGGLIFHVNNFNLVAEYFYDGSDKLIKNDHNFGLTMAYRRLGGIPLHIFANVQHTLYDQTGGAMIALTYTGFKDFEFRLGFPFLWGKENGRYTVSLNKHEMVIADFDSNTEFYQSWDKRISGFFTISLSKDF